MSPCAARALCHCEPEGSEFSLTKEPTKTPRLLLIEDDPDTALLMQEQLHDHFGQNCVTHVSSVAEGMAVDVSQFDLVISDMNLPDGTGTELLNEYHRRRRDLPIVFVTGEGVMDNAIQAIRNGAEDYVVKAGDYLFAIPVIVEKNLQIAKTRQENTRLREELERTLAEVKLKNSQLEEAVQKLETMASTDPLTGIFNRRAFNQALDRSYQQAERYSRDLASIMIDLDGFKSLNDTKGHACGDELLQMCAKVLQANCRRSDVAGRLGGDEFVLLLPETDVETAAGVAKRVQKQFLSDARARFFADDPEGAKGFGMSLGISALRHSSPRSAQQLVAHADHALYRAKAGGKLRIEIYVNPEDTAEAQPRVAQRRAG